MPCVKDVDGSEFVKFYADHLKRQGKMELPAWMDIVKTGSHKELAPVNPDWYYIRAASIARKIYLRPNIGVGRLARFFGSANRRGARPQHNHKGSTGLIRHILQQLEKIGVLAQADNSKGRVITSQGQQDLDRIASNLHNSKKASEEDEEDENDGVSDSSSEEESASEESESEEEEDSE